MDIEEASTASADIADIQEENQSRQYQTSSQCPFRNGIYNGNSANSIRRFHVLDEVENESESEHSEYSDSDIPDEEVERMLEEALVKKKRTASEAISGIVRE